MLDRTWVAKVRSMCNNHPPHKLDSHSTKGDSTHHYWPCDDLRAAVTGLTERGPVVRLAEQLTMLLKVPVGQALAALGASGTREGQVGCYHWLLNYKSCIYLNHLMNT